MSRRNAARTRSVLSPAAASRGAAFDILSAVLERKQSFDMAVEAALSGSDLEPRDRAFARLLATTAIRRLGQIDDALSRLLDRPLPLRPPALMNLLRIGAAQLLFVGTPAHAAVATTVDVADHRGLSHGKGMVNAVLRRLSREGAEIVAEQDAARLNLPEWLRARWLKNYGNDGLAAIVAQHLVEPPLDINLMPASDFDLWAERLGAVRSPTGTLRRPVGGRITELPGFDEPAWWVQDAAASLPVRLFGDLSDQTVYDLCAAPGGKTIQLAAAGAKVTAIDRSPARLALVRENLHRLGLNATVIAADALAWEPADGPADAVLLDAPCSATGTVRRHPDVIWLRQPRDLEQLTRLQTALLERAAHLLKTGGVLVYCTCSLEPEEGEHQIADFLKAHKDFARVPIEASEIGGLESLITKTGDLRTLPCQFAAEGGLDGFFAARLRKIA